MISTADFLAMMKGLNTPADAAAQVKLGTVDPAYAGGNPKVTFDGESTLSGRGYAYLDSYVPIPGDRVALIQVGTTWLVVGSIDSASQFPALQRIGSIVNTAASATITTTTETVTDTLTVPLVSGRLYELVWSGSYSCNPAAVTVLWRIRDTNLAGAQLVGGRTSWNSTATHSGPPLRTYFTAVATGNKTFVITAQAASIPTALIRTGAADSPSILSATLAS